LEEAPSHSINVRQKSFYPHKRPDFAPAKIRVIDENGEQIGILTPFDALKPCQGNGALDSGGGFAHRHFPRLPPSRTTAASFTRRKKKRPRGRARNRRLSSSRKSNSRSPWTSTTTRTKKNQAVRFLTEGDKVKASLRFRGRQNGASRAWLQNHQPADWRPLARPGVVEFMPRMEGTNSARDCGALEKRKVRPSPKRPQPPEQPAAAPKTAQSVKRERFDSNTGRPCWRPASFVSCIMPDRPRPHALKFPLWLPRANLSKTFLAKYEPVIGLKCTCNCSRRTKAFCGCANRFGAEPKHECVPGLPGTARRAARASTPRPSSLPPWPPWRSTARSASGPSFARKNYFYPDLPKGYSDFAIRQSRSQSMAGLDVPTLDGSIKKNRHQPALHMEEDCGKSLHEGHAKLCHAQPIST